MNLILDGGLYSWTNAGTSNFPVGCGAADLFALEVFAAPDGAGIIYQRVVDFSLTFNTTPYAWERKSADAGATFSTWQLVGPDEIVIPSPATPYSIIALHNNTTVLVTTGAGAFVCNLPAAAGVVGHRVTIVKIDSGVGVIQIAPNGADVIANAGNVSAYIGAQFRHITLQAQAVGQWVVIGGEWQPAQAVDTNGTHLSMGRLHLFNKTTTTARNKTIPIAAGWYGPVSAGGTVGIPDGAKGIRAKVYMGITASGPLLSGTVHYYLYAAFSTNDATVASGWGTTAFPCSCVSDTSTEVGSLCRTFTEIDIPLNSSGKFYVYLDYDMIITAASFCYVVPLGYYMGD
jgi:hypothetical protein